VIIAESFGSIYERNAINNAMPIMVSEGVVDKISDKDEISVDFETGEVFDKTKNKKFDVKPFSKSQLEIYKRDGLLN
jgi:3-isopropylmalate dehydratase small subunit